MSGRGVTATVAIEFTDGARAQAVCRTGQCTWRGTAWLNVDTARFEQALHRDDHAKET
ncbi:hypothetical protein [Streptosporangium longisporum]|uniref:Uncharacterized protein n=1 Tax=Streptosporangium longisporum TaxID=46187 RepID=A0ABP6L3R0_9ACTN